MYDRLRKSVVCNSLMGIEFDPSTASLKFQSKVDPRWCQDGPFSFCVSLPLFLRIRPHRIRPILPIPRILPEIQLQILPEIKSRLMDAIITGLLGRSGPKKKKNYRVHLMHLHIRTPHFYSSFISSY